MEPQSTNGSNDRDSLGRFAKGNAEFKDFGDAADWVSACEGLMTHLQRQTIRISLAKL